MQKGQTDESNTKWHTLSVEKTFESLSSGESGISDSIAQQRLIEHGPNCLPQAKRPNLILRFFAHFHNILIYVLLVSACITALLGHYIDTGVILAVVIVNAVIGYIQEGKAEQAMDAIRHILAPQANVVRASERKTVSGQDLVLGDVVLLEAGDKVPADLRLFSTHSLSIQEAILTGESLPVEKNTLTSADEAAIGDRKGMAYSGTLVSQGQARGVVVATGADTEIGRISGLLSKVETLRTPLVAQMGVFAKWLTFMILLLASLLLAFGYFVFNYPFTDMFMAVVGLSVAAIPEGLPTVLTITLAIGVKAMAKRNAIVRRLPAIETIGSVSVICTDKTGTLTRNEMMVASLITHNNIYTVSGNGYEPKGSVQLAGKTIPPEKYKEYHEIGLACAICNNAELKQQGDTWRAEGDPMEAALLSFSEKLALSFKDEQKKWTRTDVIPFDARHRYMATLNHYPDYDQDQHAYVFVKGAPEKILAMCENQRGSNGTSEALNTDYWHHAIEETAAHGQRLLALAILPVSAQKTALEHEDISGKLTLVGMLGMIDPPRAEAISAIVECHQAGIAVKMITGDHTKTAAAIGQQIGLRNTNKVLTGADIDAMDDAAIKQAVLDCDVFARTSPEHKLKLVMALQSHGMTVAMTGDGVNDAPSLKRADAGIAMGLKGSEAAKEAADLVLADDNFSSIVAGVREGRTVYDNLKKVISWTLPTNAGEAITIIVALLLGMTLPITAVQILWVNLITAITLGIALAFEPTEESTMQRPPRNRTDPLLNGTLVWHVVFVSFLFLCGIFGIFQYAIERGYSVDLARTMAMNTLVVMEIFQLFFIRNIYSTSLTWKAVRGTRMVWLVVIIVGVAQLAISYLPSLQKIFATQAIGFFDGLLILTIGVALFAIIETEKQIRLAIIRMRAAE